MEEFENTFKELRAWAEINLDAMQLNFETAKKKMPESMKMLAVIKADAYGHGAVRVAQLMEECGVDYFAVSMTDEALELRHAGITSPILILGHIPTSDFPSAVKYDLTVTVADENDAKVLSACAVSQGKNVKVHIALDTGMSRIGFLCCLESVDAIRRSVALPGLIGEGIFTHFATADSKDKTYAKQQLAQYEKMICALRDAGVRFPIRHAYNSAAIVDFAPRYEMVRQGITLYGMCPSDEVNLKEYGTLCPVMSLRSHVVHLKTLPAGIPVSYGCTYVTTRETKIATVSIGYADGYPRHLSSKGEALIRGCRVGVIGRVCMDQLMLDVTALDTVMVGDTVTLFGADGKEKITADEVAQKAGTIGYELICDINQRVPRVYLRGGKVDGIRRFLPND